MFKYKCSSLLVAAGGDWLRHTEGRGSCILTSPLGHYCRLGILIYMGGGLECPYVYIVDSFNSFNRLSLSFVKPVHVCFWLIGLVN